MRLGIGPNKPVCASGGGKVPGHTGRRYGVVPPDAYLTR
ncbi:hypothetical protein QO014_002435 [Kaistia dalseonensis]|uniref:Uncharacterized protein n=1 Tax=Kaistia dalseonensis TaxID=410840 RepID=A0ABU0H830_9HYPH|nr:hypothetical protein [Kaistia dalseonensis]